MKLINKRKLLLDETEILHNKKQKINEDNIISKKRKKHHKTLPKLSIKKRKTTKQNTTDKTVWWVKDISSLQEIHFIHTFLVWT